MDNFQSPEQPVNISSVSRLALAMALQVDNIPIIKSIVMCEI